jgi:hypothetical protein
MPTVTSTEKVIRNALEEIGMQQVLNLVSKWIFASIVQAMTLFVKTWRQIFSCV